MPTVLGEREGETVRCAIREQRAGSPESLRPEACADVF